MPMRAGRRGKQRHEIYDRRHRLRHGARPRLSGPGRGGGCRRHRQRPVRGRRQQAWRAGQRRQGRLPHRAVHALGRGGGAVEGTAFRQARAGDGALLHGRQQSERVGQGQAGDAGLRHAPARPGGRPRPRHHFRAGLLGAHAPAAVRFRLRPRARARRQTRCREGQGFRRRQSGDHETGGLAQCAPGPGELCRRRLLGRPRLYADERQGRGAGW